LRANHGKENSSKKTYSSSAGGIENLKAKTNENDSIQLKPCLNGSNIVGPTSSNIVEIMAQTASFSNIFVKTRFRV
jgi:hypothetical protein